MGKEKSKFHLKLINKAEVNYNAKFLLNPKWVYKLKELKIIK